MSRRGIRCENCEAIIPAGEFMCPRCRTVQRGSERRSKVPPWPRTKVGKNIERGCLPFGGTLLLLAIAALVLMAACGPGRAVGPAPTGSAAPRNPSLDTVDVSFGDATVVAEIADEHSERLLGLMHRPSLRRDAGMLFVFPAKSSGGFWMKNTLIPLQIAYLGRTGELSYEVIAILDMEPCPAEEERCPNYPPGRPYDAALEVNQGWFDEAGVEVGDEAKLSRAVEAQDPA